MKSVTVTQKGQITIPKAFREILGIEKRGKVNLRVNKRKGVIEIEPTLDLVDMAGKFKVKSELLKKYPIENHRDWLYDKKNVDGKYLKSRGI